MSYTSQHTTELLPLVEPRMSTQSARLPYILGDTAELHASSTTRSESSSHVVPHSSHDRTRRGHTTSSRVTKSYVRRGRVVSRQHSRPRVAFHKYITSFFGSIHHGRSTALGTSQPESRASSFGSKLGFSFHGSVPSVELVSPTTFIFSWPSLQSMSSVDDSTSRLPSPTSTGCKRQPLSQILTDSFSMLDEANSLDDGLLEPVVEIGIVQTMSDVLFGTSTPSELSTTAPPKHRAHNEPYGSIHKSCNGNMRKIISHDIATGLCQPESVACALATLLSPYLDLAT
jgi:hypothetical protein